MFLEKRIEESLRVQAFVCGHLRRLADISDVNEGLDIINALEVDIGGMSISQIVLLLSHLEAVMAMEILELGERLVLIRRIAVLIEQWLSSAAFQPDPERFSRPVYSSIMVQTEDPFILLVMCRLILRYVNISGRHVEDPCVIMVEEVLEGVTVGERLLQLLHHPSYPLRAVVIEIIYNVLDMDREDCFSTIGERLASSARELLALPNLNLLLDGCTERKPALLNLFVTVGKRFPAFIHRSIDLGLMDDVMLIVESFREEFLNYDHNHKCDADTSERAEFRMGGILEFLYTLIMEFQAPKILEICCVDTLRNCIRQFESLYPDFSEPMFHSWFFELILV
eukprot:Protomagalhaensia_wolfi_Nauph_80__1143@NODE_1673_length_1405_cov_68_959004_g1297_i0_p1_GENE_NODE_1673_length_1405_cov_68_959004_g1297_i0NODE_1673_length_1405_cov_68_959004_g1297_i0_p1_ORF_typecomplete_len339_score47_34RICTOR_N/PF14664_6/0_086_NODE_1673_length_1405_cov_68_959004_g1297_i01221138